MAHFVECVREGKEPSPGPSHGLAVMRIVDGAYKSAKTGKAVDVSLLNMDLD